MLVGPAACASDAHGAAPIAVDARVIVRFRPGVADASDPAFLDALAKSARVARIELIRPMSGDAYVMRIVCGDVPTPPARDACDACDAAIARVRAAAPILTIEPDRRETLR